jgi:hypothetical protein
MRRTVSAAPRTTAAARHGSASHGGGHRELRAVVARGLVACASLVLILAASSSALAEETATPDPEAGTTDASSMQSALDRQLAEMPSGEEGVDRILGELTERLTLTGAQQTAIRPIVGDAVASMERVRDRYLAGEISLMALGMQVQMAGQKAATRVEPHLTPEQAEEYAAMRAEQRREMMKAIQQAASGTFGGPAPAGAQ